MNLIALEEAFAIPGIAEPMPQLSERTGSFAEEWSRKLRRRRISEKIAHGNAERILKI